MQRTTRQRPEPVRQRRHDRGATMVEYALLIVLIGVALVGAWTFFATALDSSARDSGSALDSVYAG